MKRIDLHVHTTASDGTVTPADVVALAKEASLSAIAITDHDTVLGYEEAAQAGEKLGIEVFPGIELSTKYKSAAHVLGYFIDVDNKELKKELKGIVDDRDIRNEKTVALMRQDGISITYDEMKARFGEVVGRPHFAEILVEYGLAEDSADAFRRYVGKGMRYWLPRTTIPIERCIELILTAGGIPVLAHPFEYKYEDKSLAELIEHCMAAGLQGIECRHSSHTPGQMAYLELLADEYGLFKTGGSDFHGTVKPDISLGTGKGLVSVPYTWLEKLKERA